MELVLYLEPLLRLFNTQLALLIELVYSTKVFGILLPAYLALALESPEQGCLLQDELLLDILYVPWRSIFINYFFEVSVEDIKV